MRPWMIALVALAAACSDEAVPVGAADAAAGLADAAVPADAATARTDAAPDAAIAAPDAAAAAPDAAAGAPDAAAAAPDAAVGAPDAAPACDPNVVTPAPPCGTAFTPDSPTEPWLSGGSSAIAAGAAQHRCIDAITNPGQATHLIGKFAYGRLDLDLSGEHVEVWLQDAACAWRKLGTEVSSTNNQHGTVAGVADDGGRVFYALGAADVPAPGRYPIKMLVKGDHTAADCQLFVWPAGTHVVVSDIDGTITTREIDGFTTLFDPSSPMAHPGVVDTYRGWAAKDYRIIYLTARPEMFTRGTRDWFIAQGFADGALHLSQSNFGEFGNAAIDYKAEYLEALVADQHLVLDAAYGNKDTDLAAYQRAGVPSAQIRLFAYDAALMGAARIDDYQPEAARVSCLPVVTQP